MSECDSFCFYGGKLVEAGRQCVVVEVDKVCGSWVYREGAVRHDVGYTGGERDRADGLEVSEGYCAILFGLGGGNVNVQGDGQMVGDGEVGVGEISDAEASGTDQVQNVSAVVGGKINMLSEVKTIEYVQEIYCTFAVWGVNV